MALWYYKQKRCCTRISRKDDFVFNRDTSNTQHAIKHHNRHYLITHTLLQNLHKTWVAIPTNRCRRRNIYKKYISICLPLLLWYFVKKFQFPGPSGLGKIISAYYNQSKNHFQSVLKYYFRNVCLLFACKLAVANL